MLRLVLLGIALLCSWSVAQVVPDDMQEAGYFYPRPVFLPQTIYVKPTNLITRETFTRAPPTGPLTYHFITDYPHAHIPENFYLKPGTLVANMDVDSAPIYFKNQAHEENVALNKQKNILYLAFPVLRNVAADENT